MKKFICVLILLLLTSGCMKAIESATGLQITQNTDPVMELEMDLVFLDELAAMTKLNQIILERLPISLQDPWPALLNDYSAGPRSGEKRRYGAYKKCLTKLLKDDFVFYRAYNPSAYFRVLAGNAKGVQALLAQGLIAARNSLIMDAAMEMGRKYEHGKWVISYYPLGCKCPFYSARIEHLTPGCAQCRQFDRRTDCPFFSRPTEEMLYRYLMSEDGMSSWEDLRISPECLRIVEGERLGSFKTVYYTLFPDHIRDEAAKVDADLESAESQLKAIKARFKEKGLDDRQRKRLEQEAENLEDLVKDLVAVQKKLHETALTTLEPTPEKIRKARKLLEITKFIQEGYDEISTAMFALTVKMADDMIAFPEMGSVQMNQSGISLSKKGVATKPLSKNRMKYLTQRLAALPVNYASILGYAMSQESLVNEYRDYLEAVAAMADKLKRQ